jgi:hypothetical protein
MTSFSSLLVPLASLAISLGICVQLFRRGWSRVLPAFTGYITFYWISTLVLLSVLIWSWYPGRMQRTLCTIYNNSYYASAVVGFMLVVIVVYELFRFTGRSEPRIPARIVGLLGLAALATAVGFGFAAALKSGSASSCCLMTLFASVVMKTGTLIVTAMLLTLFICKLTFGISWGRSVSLIVTGLAAYYMIGLAVSYFEFVHGASAPTSNITVHASALVGLALWWIAVPSTHSLPPKTQQLR